MEIKHEHEHEHSHEHGHSHSHDGHDGHTHPHRHKDHGHLHTTHEHEHGDHHVHSHEHSHVYFADIRADLASQLFGLPHRVPDTVEITELKAKLDAAPDDYDTLMELAEKLNFQLRYLEAIALYDRALAVRPDDYDALYDRAARYYKTMQFDKALSDYLRCLEMSPDNREVLYRLGITEYVLKMGDDAQRRLVRCMELFADDPEMLVASAYWLALVSLRENTGNETWKSYDFSIATPHHTGYRDALRVLCGLDNAEAAYETWAENADTLSASIVLYALSVHHRAAGNAARADEVYSVLMNIDKYWAGFAYVAAWAERLPKYV